MEHANASWWGMEAGGPWYLVEHGIWSGMVSGGVQ